jgi:hypothetical protein
MRQLKVAQIDNGEALIDDGLNAGEIVVVDGQYKLQDGSHVKAAEPTVGSGGSHKKRPDKSQDTKPDKKP